MIRLSTAHTLRDALDVYTQRRLIRKRSIETLSSSVESLIAFVGDDVPVATITQDVLNNWLGSMKCKPRTVIKHRGNILSILRDASDDGHCPEPIARKIRKPRRPKPLPQAWTKEQLLAVRIAADAMTDIIRRHGVCHAAGLYFGCLVRCAYQTGLRRGNLYSLRQSDVTDAGLIYVRHEKTGAPHICSVDGLTLAMFRELPGELPLRWSDNRSFYRRWRKICAAANVPYGGPQRIRKTAATQVWLEAQDNPSRVQAFLGHLTPDMWRHYVDRSQGEHRPPRPPEL